MEQEEAAEKLRELENEVRDLVSDLDPGLITTNTAASMNKELEIINTARNKYRKSVRKFLLDYTDKLSSPEKDQWESV